MSYMTKDIYNEFSTGRILTKISTAYQKIWYRDIYLSHIRNPKSTIRNPSCRCSHGITIMQRRIAAVFLVASACRIAAAAVDVVEPFKMQIMRVGFG
jgi:hypothetical protein